MMNSLPNELWHIVRLFLPAPSLWRVGATCSHLATIFPTATVKVSDEEQGGREHPSEAVSTLQIDARVWCRQLCYGSSSRVPPNLPVFAQLARRACRVVLETTYSTPTTIRPDVVCEILRGLPKTTRWLEWRCSDTVIDGSTAGRVAFIVNNSDITRLCLIGNHTMTVRSGNRTAHNLLLAFGVGVETYPTGVSNNCVVEMLRYPNGVWKVVEPSLRIAKKRFTRNARAQGLSPVNKTLQLIPAPSLGAVSR